MSERFTYEARQAGDIWELWRVNRSRDGGLLRVDSGLDALQANVAAAVLNGNESLDFDNDGQAIIYTGYMQDEASIGSGTVMQYVPFDDPDAA